MEWVIIPLCLLLLSFTPIGIKCVYGEGGAFLWAKLGCFRFLLFPGKKKKKKAKSEKKVSKKGKKVKYESVASVKKKKNTNLLDFLPLVRLVLDFLVDFRKKLRVNNLQLKLILAGGDPCDLAVNYGKAWIALGNLMPHLERYFVIKKRNLEVECDFTANAMRVDASIDLTITIGRIFTMLGHHGFKLVRQYLQIIKKSKDGAKI